MAGSIANVAKRIKISRDSCGKEVLPWRGQQPEGTDMMETANGESQNFQNSSIDTPVQQQPTQTENERTFRQSEVNDIVGRAKHEAIERYKREASVASHTNFSQTQPPHVSGLTEDQYRKLASEEANRARDEWLLDQQRNAEEQNAQKTVNEFFTKVGAGEGGIEEFNKLVNDVGVDLRAISYHVQLANMVDNTRDVMIDLLNNPSKIGVLQNLIDIDLRAGRQPQLALKEMQRLSDGLKRNQTAEKFQPANEPLHQLRPSNAGTDNKGALTVADYKARYRC